MAAAEEGKMGRIALLAALLPALLGAAEKPLAPGEGFVVIPIVTDTRIPKIEFVGRSSGGFEIKRLHPGANLALVRARAGTYDLLKVDLVGRMFIDIQSTRQSPATIDVVAGAIVYAGDLEMDAEYMRTAFRFGGCSVDVLRSLAIADEDFELALFDRHEVIVQSRGCAELKADGAERRTLAEWERAAGRAATGHELEQLNRWLKELGKPPLALGAEGDEVWETLEGLPESRARRARDDDDPRVIALTLEGMWGWRGRHARFELYFEDEELFDVALRSSTTEGVSWFPDAEMRADVEAYLAAPAAAAVVTP
jgi:hypothetical protein